MSGHWKRVMWVVLLASISLAAFAQDNLRQAADKRGLLIGMACNRYHLNNPVFKETAVKNFNSLTAEDDMKIGYIARTAGKYNWAFADGLAQWAEENGMKVRGHTLVWHSYLPGWIEKSGWSKERALQFLQEYITTVVSRFKDRIYAWDVVNEPLEDSGQLRTDSSFWARTIGEEYIEKAFAWAHEADPAAKLFLNDYAVEELGDKSNRMYELVKKLLAKGVPIHGVGFQCHVSEENPPNFGAILQNVRRYGALGLQVQFTELDVRMTGDVSRDKLLHQGDIFKDFVRIALSEKNVTAVITWGVSDANSWITGRYKGYHTPLLFDKDFKPKPAYQAVLAALKAGPEKNLMFTPPVTNRKLMKPFRAVKTDAPPAIDGKMDKGEWDKAVIYPFAYNQLNPRNELVPAADDLEASWRILYRGRTIYGLIERRDDKTELGASNSYENDSAEVFFGIDSDFVQLRSVVGRNFEDHYYQGGQKAAWSADGTVWEFQVDLPPEALEGKIIGWNIALSDNDGSGRECQVYPVNGNNTGWQGEGFGEIEFVGPRAGERIGRAHPVPPFTASPVEKAPVVDGEVGPGEWSFGSAYGLCFNQANGADLRPPAASDLYADWRIVYNGDTLYGMLKRTDDVTIVNAKNPAENDAVDLFLEVDGKFTRLRTVVGRNFDKSPLVGKRQAVWNKDGTVLEFSIQLPKVVLKNKFIGWSIAVSDNDGRAVRDVQLFPVNGSLAGVKGRELAELQCK